MASHRNVSGSRCFLLSTGSLLYIVGDPTTAKQSIRNPNYSLRAVFEARNDIGRSWEFAITIRRCRDGAESTENATTVRQGNPHLKEAAWPSRRRRARPAPASWNIPSCFVGKIVKSYRSMSVSATQIPFLNHIELVRSVPSDQILSRSHVLAGCQPGPAYRDIFAGLVLPPLTTIQLQLEN